MRCSKSTHSVLIYSKHFINSPQPLEWTFAYTNKCKRSLLKVDVALQGALSFFFPEPFYRLLSFISCITSGSPLVMSLTDSWSLTVCFICSILDIKSVPNHEQMKKKNSLAFM